MDPEAAATVIAVIGAGGFVLLLLGLGVKLIFFRRPQLPPAVDPLLEVLEDRLQRTEGKVVELEERLDFTERMLAEARNKPQLPG